MVETRIEDAPVGWPEANAAMEARAAAVRAGAAEELLWLLEHPALYTAGTSAKPEDLLAPGRLPVFQARRGGEYTWHGPGQRVGYAVLDVAARGRDVRRFVWGLEEWIIRALARFNVEGERREGRVGVWVRRPEKGPGAEDKIAAIGVRLRRWVSFHGVALNHEPDLSHYAGIVPCGIRGHGVTSLADLGLVIAPAEVDMALLEAFEEVFGPGGPLARRGG